jgi:hypothetical protein
VCLLILGTDGYVSVVSSGRPLVCAPATASCRSDGSPAQGGVLLALVALHFASVTWTIALIARQMLWTSMVALANTTAAGGTDGSRKSSTALFNYVSWTLSALATLSTMAVVAGQLVVPLLLDDPDLQQQSVNTTYVVNAVLIFGIEVVAAAGFERLSVIARQQVRLHRDVFLPMSVNADMVSTMDDLAKRMHQLALLVLSYCPSGLTFLLVIGTYTETRQAARPRGGHVCRRARC